MFDGFKPICVLLSALCGSLLLCQQAASDEVLFASMARLIGSGPVSEVRGEQKDGNLVELFSTQSGVEAHVMSPGGDPCVLVHLWVGNDTGKYAQLSTKTYDFRKLTAARFLADADDRASAASRDPADPLVTELLLDGAGWSVHRVTHVDPAKPAFYQEVEDNWSVFLMGPEDRAAAATAVETVKAACFR